MKKTLIALTASTALVLSACGADEDPLENDAAGGDASADTIVVGSQAYYSNEIIAEIYAQALENAGYTVEREFNIGQRDAYMPAIESGEIHLFPEYTGNFLQFFEPETEARESEEVYEELTTALPDNITVLDQAPATDQDSYNVLEETNVTSIPELENVDEIVLGGPAELEHRPYGPSGLEDVYGLEVTFEATGDATVDAILSGEIVVGNVNSADPRIATENLVTLDDPENLFLASHVVPVVADEKAAEIADIINPISAALTTEELLNLNVESTENQRSSAELATEWLTQQGLI